MVKGINSYKREIYILVCHFVLSRQREPPNLALRPKIRRFVCVFWAKNEKAFTYRHGGSLDLAESGRLPALEDQQAGVDFPHRKLALVQF